MEQIATNWTERQRWWQAKILEDPSETLGKSQFTWASLKLLEPCLNLLKLARARLAKCFLSEISS